MNFSGTVSNNFRTSSSSSKVAPTLLYFDIIPEIFPAYSSIVSSSFICKASNSLFNIRSLAFCTRSAPTYRDFNESHTSLAVFFLAACESISSGIA
ncbi:hypothetical protein HanRHA438_Chr05g0247191 [Helianthus annuus]|nr:hypothetical protein HanRHA438_Chr11g0488571 [Helianthus annuus]KAJ0888864.1 hypothetical protein HanRHA438_Chr09g0406731 [Helianthus annuus]KAJ0920980.1 hypothetical protein HanRHA438_Chr05g0247191 [Helianthus annuus]